MDLDTFLREIVNPERRSYSPNEVVAIVRLAWQQAKEELVANTEHIIFKEYGTVPTPTRRTKK